MNPLTVMIMSDDGLTIPDEEFFDKFNEVPINKEFVIIQRMNDNVMQIADTVKVFKTSVKRRNLLFYGFDYLNSFHPSLDKEDFILTIGNADGNGEIFNPISFDPMIVFELYFYAVTSGFSVAISCSSNIVTEEEIRDKDIVKVKVEQAPKYDTTRFLRHKNMKAKEFFRYDENAKGRHIPKLLAFNGFTLYKVKVFEEVMRTTGIWGSIEQQDILKNTNYNVGVCITDREVSYGDYRSEG